METAWDATCTDEGRQVRYCQNGCTHGCCEPETREISALGHVWPDNWTVVTAPCCNTSGSAIKRCERDASHKQRTTLDPLGCDWGAWETAWAATCTDEGRQIRYCQNGCDPDECGCCTQSEWEDIPIIPHQCSWVTTVEATCASAGQKDYVCGMCNGIFSDDPEEIPKLAHSNVEVVDNPYPPNSAQGTWIHYHHCKDCDHFHYCKKNEGCTYPGDDGDW